MSAITSRHQPPWSATRSQARLALAYSTGAAALAGVVVSALTLAGLVVSYGQGLFGWHEAGFRTSIALDVITTVVAMIALTLALTVEAAGGRETATRSSVRRGSVS